MVGVVLVEGVEGKEVVGGVARVQVEGIVGIIRESKGIKDRRAGVKLQVEIVGVRVAVQVVEVVAVEIEG